MMMMFFVGMLQRQVGTLGASDMWIDLSDGLEDSVIIAGTGDVR
jgi:hypothetical protein